MGSSRPRGDAEGRGVRGAAEAALLVFLAAAAGARIVAADTAQRVDRGHELREQRQRRHVAHPLALPVALLREAVPAGQLLDGVAEQRVLAIARGWLRRVEERQRQVVLEVGILEPAGIYEVPVKRLPDDVLQLHEPEHGDGALPSVPDEAALPRLQVDPAVAQEGG